MPLFNPAVTPAGSTTQVQYNNAGAFGASSNFTYDSGTNTLGTGDITGTALGMTIQPKIPGILDAGDNLNVKTPDAVKSNTSAGWLWLSGGRGLGAGQGGRFIMQAGPGGAAGNGGDFYQTAGSSSSANGGGFFSVAGGGATLGGAFQMQAGSAFGSGGVAGNLELSAGTGQGLAGTGGSVQITAGSGNPGGYGGSILLIIGGTGGVGETGLFQVLGDSGFASIITATDDGVGVTQLGFFDATPVAKQDTSIATITRTAVAGGNAVDDNDTFGGYTIGQIVTALKAYGLLA